MDGLLDSCSGIPRADVLGGMYRGNLVEKDSNFGNGKIKKITVNGVDLMDIQRRKKLEKLSTPTPGKKKSTKRKINDQKTAPSSNSKENIKQYFNRRNLENKRNKEEEDSTVDNKNTREEDKKEESDKKVNDEEVTDNMKCVKKTFSSIDTTKFRENIKKFKLMSKGTECMIRSGYCSSHNQKMIRKIVNKKMSNEDEYGVVTWTNRESTVMYCPSNFSKQTNSVPKPMMSQLPEVVEGTN